MAQEEYKPDKSERTPILPTTSKEKVEWYHRGINNVWAKSPQDERWRRLDTGKRIGPDMADLVGIKMLKNEEEFKWE